MRDDGPSRTAFAVAHWRAAHQVIDKPTVFTDPLARAILPPVLQERLDADPYDRNRGRSASHLRAFLAVRSRIAEDQLARAYTVGVRQYVLLGAGLDTFACRNPFPDLKVFEVDHPRSQEWKRRRLKEAELSVSKDTVFVPINFESESIGDTMTSHGLLASAPTAVSWLGVVPYLDLATIRETLVWVASIIGDEGHVVFDYSSPPQWWQLRYRLASYRMARRVAAAGEPFKPRLTPMQVNRELSDLGFSTVINLDSHHLNERYFANRQDGLRIAGGAHVVCAGRYQVE